MKEMSLRPKPPKSLEQASEKNVSDLTFKKVTLKTGVKAGINDDGGGPSGIDCGAGSTLGCVGGGK